MHTLRSTLLTCASAGLLAAALAWSVVPGQAQQGWADGPDGGPPPYAMPDGPGGYGQGGYGQDMGPGPYGGGGPYRRQMRADREDGIGNSGPRKRVSYHGFKLEIPANVNGGPERAVAAAEHQIDIVDRAGLSQADLQLFRSLPIKVTVGGLGGGHFRGGHEVAIGGMTANDNRPVLLHEYMHAYHYFRMPGGFQNPDIRRFYEEAVSRGLYEANSYMLSNPGEFFAMTASCYLNGTVARAPYSRDRIRESQPDYYAYLAHLFGPV